MSESNQPVEAKRGAVKPEKKPVGVRIVLVLLAILFVISAVLALAGYDIWRVVFNPPVIKDILVTEFLDSDLVPAVLADLSIRRAQERVEKGESLSGVNEPDIQLLLSYVSFESWDEIRDLIITDAFVTDLVSVTVDGLYDWIDSDDFAPGFAWDMTPLKDRLVGEQGAQSVMIAYESMPECTQAEIDDFTSRLEEVPPGVEVLYNLCQFPDPWREDQIDDYLNAVVDVNQNIPASYDFDQVMMLASMTLTSSGTRPTLRLIRFVGHWGWALPLALLALIVALGVRSWRNLGAWAGIPLLITGGLAAVVAAPVRAALLNLIVNRFPSLSDLLREEMRQSLIRVTDAVFQPMLLQGLILLGVGAVLIVLGIVLRKKTQPVAVEEAAAE